MERRDIYHNHLAPFPFRCFFSLQTNRSKSLRIVEHKSRYVTSKLFRLRDDEMIDGVKCDVQRTPTAAPAKNDFKVLITTRHWNVLIILVVRALALLIAIWILYDGLRSTSTSTIFISCDCIQSWSYQGLRTGEHVAFETIADECNIAVALTITDNFSFLLRYMGPLTTTVHSRRCIESLQLSSSLAIAHWTESNAWMNRTALILITSIYVAQSAMEKKTGRSGWKWRWSRKKTHAFDSLYCDCCLLISVQFVLGHMISLRQCLGVGILSSHDMHAIHSRRWTYRQPDVMRTKRTYCLRVKQNIKKS